MYHVNHRTAYRYAEPVVQSRHLIHLSPRQVSHQIVHRHSLIIEPQPSDRIDRTDYFGNPVSMLTVDEDHTDLVIDATSSIEVQPTEQHALASSMPWDELSFMHAGSLGAAKLDIAQYICSSRQTPMSSTLLEYALPSFPAGCPILEGVQQLTSRIHKEFEYDPTATDVATPLDAVMRMRRGVCQDFAHLQIACLRTLGLAARYVSGYVLTYSSNGQDRLIGADASHAWLSVWEPKFGWVDFDPTNDKLPAEEHVTLAYGRDFDDVSPISGVLLGGGAHKVDVAVAVEPVVTNLSD